MATRSDVSPRLRPVPFREALDWAEARKVVPSETYYGTLQGFARAKAFSVAGLSSMTQLQGVLDSLNAVMRKGGTMAEWKKLVRDGKVPLNLPNHRLDTIFRTNVLGAYARGRAQQQEEVKDAFPFLMYDAVNDSRTRPAHRALDNHVARYEDPFWQTHTPPLGYNCRCKVISLTEGQARRRGYDPEALPPPPDAQADAGWDWNKREALERSGASIDPGIAQAITKAVAKAPPAIAAVAPAKLTPPQGVAMGEPVGTTLTIKKGKDYEPFHYILGEIRQIHGDGNLLKTEAAVGRQTTSFGYYKPRPTLRGQPLPPGHPWDRPAKVNYSKRLADGEHGHKETTLAHEIGHWIDHEGVGDLKSFASETLPEFEEWRQAVKATPEWKRLQEIRVDRSIDYDNRRLASYYLQLHEAWARSYAQYIARKSGKQLLQDQIAAIRTRGPAMSVSQWTDDSFAPIEQAMDNLFKKLGWRS